MRRVVEVGLTGMRRALLVVAVVGLLSGCTSKAGTGTVTSSSSSPVATPRTVAATFASGAFHFSLRYDPHWFRARVYPVQSRGPLDLTAVGTVVLAGSLYVEIDPKAPGNRAVVTVLALRPVHALRWPTLSQFERRVIVGGAIRGPARPAALGGLDVVSFPETDPIPGPVYDVYYIYHSGFIYIVNSPVRTASPITARLDQVAATFRITP